MGYSAHSYCCKQIANKDFDKENGRCFICQGRWRIKRERRLEKDKINKRRDREENPERYKATSQIEIDCKACDCCIRTYQWWRHRKTAKHLKNGGPEMEEEERKMKEEEEERNGKRRRRRRNWKRQKNRL